MINSHLLTLSAFVAASFAAGVLVNGCDGQITISLH